MPIYEYKCLQCGRHFETRQKVSDAPLTTCEKCHGQLEKQWSLSGFQFKGAGWYVTDYSGNRSGEKTGKSSSDDSTGSAESASKSKDDSGGGKTSEPTAKSD